MTDIIDRLRRVTLHACNPFRRADILEAADEIEMLRAEVEREREVTYHLEQEVERLRHALQRIANGDVSPAIDFARGVLVEVSND